MTKGDAFNTLYHQQPKERWGMKSDVFRAWAAKLPDDPFKGLLTQIHSLDLISAGPSVLDDFDKANRMLCALYSHWCADHPRVMITAGMQPRALVAKGGSKGDGWMVCFRCWERWAATCRMTARRRLRSASAAGSMAARGRRAAASMSLQSAW